MLAFLVLLLLETSVLFTLKQEVHAVPHFRSFVLFVGVFAVDSGLRASC